MKDLSAYYTAVDREIFELIDYFIALQHDFEKRGGVDLDGAKKIEEFNRFRELVEQFADRRREHTEELAEQERLEMEERMLGDCPTCKTERKADIIGEQRVNPPGVLYDRLKCTACGSTFNGPIPNTLAGRLKLAEHILQVVTTIQDDGSTLMERDHRQEHVAQLMQSIKDLKKANRDVEMNDATREQSRANADQQLVNTRDMLLLWKLRAANPGGQGGMA